MYSAGVVFGERVVVLGDAPARLPGRVLLPGDRAVGSWLAGRAEVGVECGTGRAFAVGGGGGLDDGDPGPGAGRCKADRGDGATAARGGVLFQPGRGVTVSDRVASAVDPVAAAQRAGAEAALGLAPVAQDAVDLSVAERLCPPGRGEVAAASAGLALGCWRYRVVHTTPGPELAAVLEDRPEELKPAVGGGPVDGVVGDGVAGGPVPVDPTWPQAVLDGIVARQKLMSHLQAQQYADIAELSACYPGIHQFLATELALALHITEGDAAGLLGVAEGLRDRLPDTLRALAAGRIDDATAIAVYRATAHCTDRVAATVEQRILPQAETLTAGAVRRRAARLVIAADPDGAADRHRQARRERHVWRAPDDDGMARLGIYAPAGQINTIWEAIGQTADAIRTPGDTRTLGQRRVDAAVMICSDILAGGGWAALKLPDTGRGKPHIAVTVPITALLGERVPCELAGYGPIPTEQALPIIADGDLLRMLCDPASGQLLDYGHTRYKPPPHLAAFVRARDRSCVAPGCDQPADRAHIDHVIPARPDPVTGKPTLGTTSATNLAPLCTHHHLAKDAGRGFHLHRHDDGTYTWTTPLGRTYTHHPEPHWHTNARTGNGGKPSPDSRGSDHNPGRGNELDTGCDHDQKINTECDCGCGARRDPTDNHNPNHPDHRCSSNPSPPPADDHITDLTVDHDWADGITHTHTHTDSGTGKPRTAATRRDPSDDADSTNPPPAEAGQDPPPY